MKLSKNEVLTKFELTESSEDYAKFSCCIRIERLLLLLLEEGSLPIEREELMESEGTRLSCAIFWHQGGISSGLSVAFGLARLWNGSISKLGLNSEVLMTGRRKVSIEIILLYLLKKWQFSSPLGINGSC